MTCPPARAVVLKFPRPDYPRAGRTRPPSLPALLAAVARPGRARVRRARRRRAPSSTRGSTCPTRTSGAGPAERPLLSRRQDAARPHRRDRPYVRPAQPTSRSPLQQAVLAAEDRGFYHHGGFAPRASPAPAWNDLRGGRSQGGSTITQQLVKNYYLTQERTLSRKVREAVVAAQDGADPEQGPDPRGLPQHHLLRPRRLRHPGGGAGLLRRTSSDLTAVAGRGPRGHHPQPRRLRPRGRTSTGSRTAGPTSSTAWSRRAGSPPGRGSRSRSPADRAKRPSETYGGTEGYLIARRARRARDARLSRGRASTAAACTSSAPSTRRPSARPWPRSTAQRPTETDVHVGLAIGGPGDRRGRRAVRRPRTTSTSSTTTPPRPPPQAGSTFKPFTLAAALENGIGLSSKWDGHSPRRSRTQRARTS